MAKAFVGRTSGSAINGGNVTLTLNSGLTGGSGSAVAEGDLVIVGGAVPSGASGTPGWPGDWTVINNGSNSAGNGRLFTALKKMGPTPDTSVTFTGDGSGTSSVAAFAHVISGADYDDTVSPTTATGSSTDPNPAAITPDENNSAVVALAFSRVNETAVTAPTNYNDLTFALGGSDTNDVSLAGAWRDGRSSGVSEDPAAFTAWATGSWRTVTFVIKDATNVQSLTPSLYTDSDTFHQPTVTPGAVGLTPSLYEDGDTFFTPTVALGGTKNLSPSLFDDGDTFHTPTATYVNAFVPSLYEDGDTFHAPTATYVNALSASLYSDADNFYAATVTRGTITLTPSLYTDADAFHSATVAQTLSVAPSLFVDDDTFYTPVVTYPQVLAQSAAFTDTDTIFEPARVAIQWRKQSDTSVSWTVQNDN
jgi:hypothetical protein